MKPLFLDVETTGTKPEDRLIQLAYKLGETYGNCLFKPPVPISIEAMAICHITEEDVADCPPFQEHSLSKELQGHLDDMSVVLVAHNAQFDMKFIEKEGIKLPPCHICTMKMAHHHDKKGELDKHTLQFLRYLYGLKFETRIDPHDAMSDVLVLEKLFAYYAEHYSIEEMIEVSSKPILLKRFPFGKYKGEWFKDVVKRDLEYMLWMRRGITDLDENLKYTLEYYINNR